MDNVKIHLITESNKNLYLTINYFPKKRGQKIRLVDNYYLTENPCWATAVPAKEARKWMREAKMLAAYDGDVVVKSKYLLGKNPVSLKTLS